MIVIVRPGLFVRMLSMNIEINVLWCSVEKAVFSVLSFIRLVALLLLSLVIFLISTSLANLRKRLEPTSTYSVAILSDALSISVGAIVLARSVLPATELVNRVL